jgi:hypothetical protein
MGPIYYKKMKLKILFLLIFLFEWCSISFSQSHSSFWQNDISIGKRRKPKNSMAKGTAFFYWGYNRSAYTRSTIHFSGIGYDFSLKGVKAVDRPSTSIGEYLNPTKITIPQFNVRVGYNITNYWNLSLGYDHLKYVMVHGQTYLLSGKINGGIDQNWSGSFFETPVTTNENDFHYENTNGMNFIRVGLSNVRNIIRNSRDNFTLSYLIGASTGVILSINDFTFGGRKDMATVSLSGLGISGNAGLRFEFVKHFFVQTNVSTGFLKQISVRTRPNEYSSIARQNLGYIEGNIVVGALFYIRPTNSCDSCPAWH